ncbi:thymidylate synthase [Bacillaceae bacterium Marseille-Q3522]|nr:thymidylate synthase [Bacillaceae bacterium Marseille-Q3522]
MSANESMYLQFCTDVIEHGEVKNDRTGTGTKSIFGYQMRFRLEEGFPLLTTKRLSFRLIASELLWFIKGDTNIKYLLEHNNHIWNEWAFQKWVEGADYDGPDMTNFGQRVLQDQEFKAEYEKEMQRFVALILTDEAFAAKYGDLGNVYGKQWRAWKTSTGETIDQLKNVIQMIKNNPDSRRLIVTAWNPEDVPANMVLPPCHSLFQFYVCNGKLSCQLYQRSADIFLGVPFNIASYSLLTHLIAKECGLQAGDFIHTIGDGHIYLNHMDQVKLQLQRQPRELPVLNIKDSFDNVFNCELDDLQLENYHPYPSIKAPIAV